jgi:ribosomal protein S18 acetylase RimI-like enzyme
VSGHNVLVRAATPADAGDLGRLFHAFQVEFDDETPGAEAFAARLAELLAGDDTAALVAGDGPEGFAILRFLPSLYSRALECYLAELYVVPSVRGRGIGRAIVEAVLVTARARGADYIHLGTSVDDVAARALYERMGFTNREGGPDGPSMLVYERAL